MTCTHTVCCSNHQLLIKACVWFGNTFSQQLYLSVYSLQSCQIPSGGKFTMTWFKLCDAFIFCGRLAEGKQKSPLLHLWGVCLPSPPTPGVISGIQEAGRQGDESGRHMHTFLTCVYELNQERKDIDKERFRSSSRSCALGRVEQFGREGKRKQRERESWKAE